MIRAVAVAIYLAAVVAANSLVARYGPALAVPVGFLLIGCTLTTRDVLHDAWQGRGLRARMAGLILAGSALSLLVNPATRRIALASTLAFVVSETIDTTVYHALRRRPWSQRSNASNLMSAAADSALFPTLAFGHFLPGIILGQYVAKTVGGAMWTVAWSRVRQRLPST